MIVPPKPKDGEKRQSAKRPDPKAWKLTKAAGANQQVAPTDVNSMYHVAKSITLLTGEEGKVGSHVLLNLTPAVS